MIVFFIFNNLLKFIQLGFSKNKLKFLKYPSITGFLSAIYDINVRDPKLKKNYIEESFDLGLELGFGYMLHDIPILILLSLLIYPKAFLKYMLFEFGIDLFFAQAYNFGHIFYVFNLYMLLPAFGCWISKYIKMLLNTPLFELIDRFVAFTYAFNLVKFNLKFQVIFSTLGYLK